MLGKLAGAVIGNRIAGRYGNGVRGALVGAAVPFVLRRATRPLGLALMGGYAAKKFFDYRRARRQEPSAASIDVAPTR